MNKRTLFRALALMLTVVMLLSTLVIAVGAEQPPVTDETTDESDAQSSENTILREDRWYIAYKNITTYSLVRSRDAMNLVKAKMIEVQENFKKWTAADPKAAIDKENDYKLGEDAGADLDLVTNASQLTNQEILVGQTGTVGRADAEARAQELGIGTADFFIEVKEDGDVWIVGGSNTATTVAVDFCINNVFEVNTDERYICVKKNYLYVYHNDPATVRPSSEITKEGKTALEFTVSPNTMEDVFARLTFAKLGGWRIQNKVSFTADFTDYGASQMLALSIGELPDVSVEELTYETLSDGGLKVLAPDGSYAIMYTEPFKLTFYTAKGSVAQTVTALEYAVTGGHTVGTVRLDLIEKEPVYGGGQRFDNVNLNLLDSTTGEAIGQKLVLYSTDIWENNEHVDSTWQSQIVIPFFSNLHGAGVFMNRNEYMVADIGKAKSTEMSLSVTEGLIDFYVFTTESISDSIGKYCEVSGANSMPEEWNYGMIVCRAYPDFSNLEKTYAIIAKMEQYSLPWTGITVQGWNAYDDSKLGELQVLCDYVHSLGKKVMVTVTVGDFPGASEMDAAIREEEALPSGEKPEVPAPNYFMEYKTSANKKHSFIDSLGATVYDKKVPNCDPEMLYIGLLDSESIQPNTTEKAYFYLDITNPEAVNWFFGEYWENMTNVIGVDGVKLEGGYRLPDTAGTFTLYDDGMARDGLHHYYPMAFSAMLWDMISAKPDSGMCFVRGGGIGAQRLSYVGVADQACKWNRLKRQLVAMVTAGLSGVAFTTFDIGGSKYDGSLEVGVEAAIFLRSMQMATFSTAMQVSGAGTLQPHDYVGLEAPLIDNKTGKVTVSKDTKEPVMYDYTYVAEIYKIYTMIHEALVPYLNEQSEIACENGTPVVQAMVLQYSNDANVYDTKDQYMLGDAFLVAPALPSDYKNNLNTKRKEDIYLPAGEWIDLLSGERISVPEGGMLYTEYTKNNSLTQGQIPVFYNVNNTSEVAPSIYGEIQELLAMASAIETP